MSIIFQVLGAPGRDNAVLVRVDSGQAITRLLFDCGEACLDDLAPAEVLAIDHVLFSHLHMDHVGGFDSLFRRTYNRASKPNVIWGPPETGRIMHHRFRGFLWNLHADQPGTWYVNDIVPDRVAGWRYEAAEAFAHAHDLGARLLGGPILDTPAFTVAALQMDHLTPSLAYVVREKPRLHVDNAQIERLGLPYGPWLRQLKDPAAGPTVNIGGVQHDLAALRELLLLAQPGASLAYLTDFLLDDDAVARLLPAVSGCDTLICESQYRHADLALARRNYHMTAAQAADLAQRAGAGELVLVHLSEQYQREGRLELLEEARAIFPNTHFPEHWRAALL